MPDGTESEPERKALQVGNTEHLLRVRIAALECATRLVAKFQPALPVTIDRKTAWVREMASEFEQHLLRPVEPES